MSADVSIDRAIHPDCHAAHHAHPDDALNITYNLSGMLKDAGFSKKQIWSASKKSRVVRKKDGMKGGWLWRLPGIQPLAWARNQRLSAGSLIRSSAVRSSAGRWSTM